MIFLKNNEVFKMLCCFILLMGLFMSSLPVVQGMNEGQNIQPRYQFRRYTDNSKSLQQMYYHIYVPDDYDESLAYPLVIYLSLIGQDVAVNSQKYIDSSLLTDENIENYPCIILIPLMPEDSYWVYNYFGEISPGLDLTMSMIDFVCQEYSVDQRKIYITGLCSTATGVWDALFRFPHKFAAGVIVANIAPLSLASKISDVPLWIFSSNADSLLSVTQARGMVEALEEAGNTEVQYTEYENYDHVQASIAPFWEEDLFPWMFSQINTNVSLPKGKIPVGVFKEDPMIKDLLLGENTDALNDEDIIPEQKDNIEDKDRIAEPENYQINLELQIVSIFVAVTICLDALLLLLYKKHLKELCLTRKIENK